ncbi:MAG: delta-lactam-biosynthetic de-N-acetylase [Ruminococcaceae bacterium]|nr:delta-lactam-biosynthetic de-N-acetylase [Oscillospiraceae bacterium]
MKRFFAFLASALIFLSAFSISAAEKEWHFYIKRGEAHAPPSTDPSFLPIFGDHCFYLDNKAAASGEKKLYLTFDAGYENGNISKILDILKEENVPGAFFVLSHLIKSELSLLNRMNDEGHLVCNHTARHKNMAQLNKDEFFSELSALETIYTEQTGNELSKFYRPPEGTFSGENLRWANEMGYKTVFWSLAYKDWNDEVAPSREKAIEILKKNTHPGAVILLHPTTSLNAEILREMINYWRAEGYSFGSLDMIG